MAEKTISIDLAVNDKFTKGFEKFNDGLEGLAQEQKKTNQSIQKTTKSVQGLTDGVKGFVSAYISWRSLNMVKDLAMLGAEADSVSDSFEQMGQRMGFVATDLATKMRQSTDQMVDDMTLQKNAMKALISGIDPDDMLVAMQYVSRYANSVGADSEQLMQTVMTGLARGSAQFLDDVGIQVIGAQDVVGEAIDQMKEKMLDFNQNSFSSMKQFETSIKNLRIEVGKELLPALDLTVQNMDMLINTFIEGGDAVNFIGDASFNLSKSFNSMINTLAIGAEGIKGYVNGVAFAQSFAVDKMLELVRAFVNGNKIMLETANNNPLGDILVPDSAIEAMDTAISKIDEFAKVNDQAMSHFGDKVVDSAGKIETLKDGILDLIATEERENAVLQQTQRLRTGNTQATVENTIAIREQLNAMNDLALQMKWLNELDREMNDILLAQQQARNTLKDITINSAIDIASSFQSMHQSRMSQISAEFDAERQSIEDSSMSRRSKAIALEKLEKKRAKAENEARKRQVAYTAVISTANIALATQKQIMMALDAGKDTPGGALTKLAVVGSVLAGTAGLIAQVKSASSQIPKREHGGAVRRGQLYEVAENGKDEIFQSGGKTFLLPSQGGRVIPNNQMTNNANVTVNATFNGGDMGTIEQKLPELVAKGLEMADRNNSIDYGRLQNFQRAVGN